MSIASQIQRLQQAKSDIINAIETKGVQVPPSSTMDDMSELILQIGEETGDLGPIYTSYYIDQRSPESMLPEDMIIGKPAYECDEQVQFNNETVYKNVIRRIRANTHLYKSIIGQYGQYDFRQSLWQLSDNDKRYLKDEETLTFDSENTTGDIVMMLPRFWWKITEPKSNLFKVSFCMTQDDVDDSWNEWNGKVQIGVYKACNSLGRIRQHNNAGDLTTSEFNSRPNELVVVNASRDDFYYERSPMNGVPITLACHEIMALLGMGWYSTADIGRFIGNAQFSSTTGYADSFGMNDTTEQQVSQDGYQFNNFWGLENWIGGGYEYIPNCWSVPGTESFTINNYLSYSITDTYTIPRETLTKGCITKINLSGGLPFGITLPKTVISDSNYNRGFANYGGYRTTKTTYATRAGIDVKTGGLTYLNFEDPNDGNDSQITSRLMINSTSLSSTLEN